MYYNAAGIVLMDLLLGEVAGSPAESEPDAIDVESFTEVKSYQNTDQMENGREDQSPNEDTSPGKSPPTQEAFADTTSKPKLLTLQNGNHNSFNTFATISPVS